MFLLLAIFRGLIYCIELSLTLSIYYCTHSLFWKWYQSSALSHVEARPIYTHGLFSISTYLILGYSTSIGQSDISPIANVLARYYLYLMLL